MFNHMRKTTLCVFVDGNGVTADRNSKQIQSDLMQGRLVIARLHTSNDYIYALPTYYDTEHEVIWFTFVNAINNLAQIVGIDNNAEIVYWTGD